MSRKDLTEHLAGLVKAAEEDLKRFKTAIAQHKLRIYERDVNGERDITDRHLTEAEATVEEYRTLMRDWSKEADQ